jgi:predicted 3-demethylubiquinone-9 3-methyltransferase (glyoxalase superfamily)
MKGITPFLWFDGKAGRLLQDPNPVKASSVMKAMLQMDKLDIEGLERAHRQG